MDDDLKLGYHRLGRRFEDPVGLFALAAGLWALTAMMIAVIFALGISTWLLLTAGGIIALFLVRTRLAELARRWRGGRLELEHRRS